MLFKIFSDDESFRKMLSPNTWNSKIDSTIHAALIGVNGFSPNP